MERSTNENLDRLVPLEVSACLPLQRGADDLSFGRGYRHILHTATLIGRSKERLQERKHVGPQVLATNSCAKNRNLMSLLPAVLFDTEKGCNSR